MPQIPPPPSSITGALGEYLRVLWRAVHDLPQISSFSAATPSGVTGLPGDLAVNRISSATDKRLWIMGGASRVPSTSNWSQLDTV